jgi:Zn-dependent protease with chaperone function
MVWLGSDLSDMSDTTTGLFFDDASPDGRVVEVKCGPHALFLSDAGAQTRCWPYAHLVVKDRRPALTLTTLNEPDRRLIVSDALSDEIYRRAPQVFNRRAQGRTTALILSGLVAGGLSLAALVVFGLPHAAQPLATLTPASAENAIGEAVATQMALDFPTCDGPQAEAAAAAARPLIDRLYDGEGERFNIRLSFVASDTPNAMALPGGRVMATSALLEALDHPDQFAAILAHELAHVRNRDVMTGLYRSVGLGLAIDMLTGGTGAGPAILHAAGAATSLQYTRAQEARADQDALDALEAADINPGALADAFERLQTVAGDGGGYNLPEWLQSHPDTNRRIERARPLARPERPASLSETHWEQIRLACLR